MKKTALKFVMALFALSLSLACVSCSDSNSTKNGAGVNNNLKPMSQTFIATTDSVLPETLEYGVEFTIPSAKISYKGAEIPASESVLIFPNGKSSSEKSAILTISGEYTLVYSFISK